MWLASSAVVAIGEIAEECADAARVRAYEKDIEIEVSLADALPPAFADARAVKQVFLNLLVNAIKFTPASGQIHITVEQTGDVVAASVADNGPGIPPDLADRLLEPFAKRTKDPFTTEKGWGLGLSISKSLIEMQGGTIGIESVPGAGTTVTGNVPEGALVLSRTEQRVIEGYYDKRRKPREEAKRKK